MNWYFTVQNNVIYGQSLMSLAVWSLSSTLLSASWRSVFCWMVSVRRRMFWEMRARMGARGSSSMITM